MHSTLLTPSGVRWGSDSFEALGVVDIIDRTTSQTVPFRYICNIELVRATGATPLGTGVLIGPRAVLTVAHSLVDTQRCRLLRAGAIRVTPGQAGIGVRPFGSSRVRAIKVHPDICQHDLLGGDNDLDFAILILRRSFARVGFWNERRPADDDRGSTIGALAGWRPGRFKVNHSGYSALTSGFQSHWFSDTLPGSTGNRLFIDSAVQQGDSGSPVWVTRDRSLGGRQLIGMIITGFGPETPGVRVGTEGEALLILPKSKIRRFIDRHRFDTR
jgi:V8-like Glu-specific endopeptidase